MSSPIQNDETNTGMITSRTPGATVAVRMSRGGGRERDGTRNVHSAPSTSGVRESFATRTRAWGARMIPGSMLPKPSAVTWRD